MRLEVIHVSWWCTTSIGAYYDNQGNMIGGINAATQPENQGNMIGRRQRVRCQKTSLMLLQGPRNGEPVCFWCKESASMLHSDWMIPTRAVVSMLVSIVVVRAIDCLIGGLMDRLID